MSSEVQSWIGYGLRINKVVVFSFWPKFLDVSIVIDALCRSAVVWERTNEEEVIKCGLHWLVGSHWVCWVDSDIEQ